jgi:hypothetical protein
MTVYKSEYKSVYHKPECCNITDNMQAIPDARAKGSSWRKCQTCFDVIPEEKPHCPDCGDASIKSRSGGIQVNATHSPIEGWVCKECGSRFDEPDQKRLVAQ